MSRSSLRLWLPAFLYVALIFTLSSIPSLRPPSAIQFGMADKVAHLIEYAILGFLLLRALRGHRGAAGLLSFLTALLICYAIGALDEIYQGTVSGREMSLADWVADFLGATAGVFAYRIFFDRAELDGAVGSAE